MSTTLLPPDDDDASADDTKRLKPKKELVIQPLEDGFPKPLTDIPGANEDLLAELRERTAKLAEQIHGHDDPKKHVLKIDGEKVPEEDVVAALEVEETKVTTKSDDESRNANAAIELVRQKLEKLYKKEPDAADEAIESYQAGTNRSKHQKFMYELTTSGKSLADIQTQWHKYYVNLPNDEKHQVWREFYDMQSQTSHYSKATQPQSEPNQKSKGKSKKPSSANIHTSSSDTRSVGQVKAQLLDKVSAGGKLSAAQHAKSLLFGLGLAAVVGLIITFTFFNEVFIAPFISPSRSVSATPIIGTQSGRVGPESKIIIPKINLEVPVVFDMDTIEEPEIQAALEDGVVHYATTPNPGEKGNVAIVGHSSNNILNSGKYKFAFVLLKRLEAEDTFFVQKDGVRYTYKVYKKEIVSPSEVSILETQDKPNTITLITCDPPGTSINRLVIVAEQISPDPAGNKKSSALKLEDSSAETLPSNAPSLWSRLWPF